MLLHLTLQTKKSLKYSNYIKILKKITGTNKNELSVYFENDFDKYACNFINTSLSVYAFRKVTITILPLLEGTDSA